MKALAFIILLLAVGDMAFDHGAVIVRLGRASGSFAHGCATAFSDSLFSA